MDLCNAMKTGSLDIIKALVSRSGFTTDSNWHDYDALNSAVRCGRKDVVKLLLQKNCRVNKTVRSPATDTPLHNAVRLADPELVSDLLKRKASIIAVNADNNSALHIAFLLKQEDLIDLMLGSIERDSQYCNSKNNQGLTHLHVACTRSNARVIKGFLDKGALAKDVINNDSVVWAGYNCLHFAAEFKSLTAMKVLLSHNSFCISLLKYEKNSLGQTPMNLINKHLEDLSLMASLLNTIQFSHFDMACAGNDAKVVKSFLEKGADANKKISSISKGFCSSFTPLHFAVESKNDENIELLLKCGANANDRNNDDMTPVQSALYNEEPVRINQALYNATQNKLGQAPDKNGLSFMHVACSKNDVMTVKQFLDKGADINSEVSYDRQLLYRYTPLHFAVKYKNLETVKYLIQRGAAVNSGEDCVDGSPLHLACKFGYTDIIDFLLEQGADAKAVRSHDKKTTLQLLMEHCFREALASNYSAMPSISKIVKFGCDVNAQDAEGNTALHLAYNGTCTGKHFAKILLDVGADINIENNKGQTPFDCQLSNIFIDLFTKPGVYTILYHHVQKLKLIGRSVNPKNEACCKRLFEKQRSGKFKDSLDFQAEELARKHQERLDEITKLKNTKLNNAVSLYDFVRLEPEEARDFVTHETLMEMLQKEFPVYGYLLKLQHQKAAGSTEVKAEGSNKRRAVKIEPDDTPSKRPRRSRRN